MDSALVDVWSGALCASVAPKDPRWTIEEDCNEEERQVVAKELWKTVCVRCPVWEECLDWATQHEEVGVWAGTTRLERRRLACA